MPENFQPYQPPQTDLAVVTDHFRIDSKFRMSQRWWRVPFLYPFVLLGSFYGTWLIAWTELGHMPRPSMDDPYSIGGFFRVCVYLPLMVGMLLPGMLALGFIFLFYLRAAGGEQVNYRKWWLMSASYVLIWLLTFWILHVDPLSVFEWYGD